MRLAGQDRVEEVIDTNVRNAFFAVWKEDGKADVEDLRCMVNKAIRYGLNETEISVSELSKLNKPHEIPPLDEDDPIFKLMNPKKES